DDDQHLHRRHVGRRLLERLGVDREREEDRREDRRQRDDQQEREPDRGGPQVELEPGRELRRGEAGLEGVAERGGGDDGGGHRAAEDDQELRDRDVAAARRSDQQRLQREALLLAGPEVARREVAAQEAHEDQDVGEDPADQVQDLLLARRDVLLLDLDGGDEGLGQVGLGEARVADGAARLGDRLAKAAVRLFGEGPGRVPLDLEAERIGAVDDLRVERRRDAQPGVDALRRDRDRGGTARRIAPHQRRQVGVGRGGARAGRQRRDLGGAPVVERRERREEVLEAARVAQPRVVPAARAERSHLFGHGLVALAAELLLDLRLRVRQRRAQRRRARVATDARVGVEAEQDLLRRQAELLRERVELAAHLVAEQRDERVEQRVVAVRRLAQQREEAVALVGVALDDQRRATRRLLALDHEPGEDAHQPGHHEHRQRDHEDQRLAVAQDVEEFLAEDDPDRLAGHARRPSPEAISLRPPKLRATDVTPGCRQGGGERSLHGLRAD